MFPCFPLNVLAYMHAETKCCSKQNPLSDHAEIHTLHCLSIRFGVDGNVGAITKAG